MVADDPAKNTSPTNKSKKGFTRSYIAPVIVVPIRYPMKVEVMKNEAWSKLMFVISLRSSKEGPSCPITQP
jgi:hypothetical protein